MACSKQRMKGSLSSSHTTLTPYLLSAKLYCAVNRDAIILIDYYETT